MQQQHRIMIMSVVGIAALLLVAMWTLQNAPQPQERSTINKKIAELMYTNAGERTTTTEDGQQKTLVSFFIEKESATKAGLTTIIKEELKRKPELKERATFFFYDDREVAFAAVTPTDDTDYQKISEHIAAIVDTDNWTIEAGYKSLIGKKLGL